MSPTQSLQQLKVKLCHLAIYCAVGLHSGAAHASGFFDAAMQDFSSSEIVFQRTTSNVPFMPLAYIEHKVYGDTTLVLEDKSKISIDQTTFSQSAIVPFLASPKDIIFVGEWVNNSHLKSNNASFESFDVTQAALPVGWLRQVDKRTQVGGFIAPLAYKASIENSQWSWETLGGIFSRKVHSETTWWAFGLYFNVGGLEDTYLPYLGAYFQLSDQWSLSAIIPWPAILYAPTQDSLFRFGASPTGSSWQLDQESTEISQKISGWDFGLSGEHRIYENLWLKLEGGVGGLRALRLENGDLQAPDFKVDASSYIKFGINFRPSVR